MATIIAVVVDDQWFDFAGPRVSRRRGNRIALQSNCRKCHDLFEQVVSKDEIFECCNLTPYCLECRPLNKRTSHRRPRQVIIILNELFSTYQRNRLIRTSRLNMHRKDHKVRRCTAKITQL
jgi:hypothetical protein